jgi:hypothetical protein
LLHASFRPRLATTPLRFANPSPPSGWVEDLHLQAVKHARHTRSRGRQERAHRCLENAETAFPTPSTGVTLAKAVRSFVKRKRTDHLLTTGAAPLAATAQPGDDPGRGSVQRPRGVAGRGGRRADDFRWSRTKTGREACDPPELKFRFHIPPPTLASRSRSTAFVHRPRVTSATTSSGLSATWSGPAASRAALGNGPHAAAIVRMPAARPAATSCTLSPT